MSRASNLAGFTTSISAEGADLNVGIVTAISIISKDKYSFQSVQGTQAEFSELLITGVSTFAGDVSIGGTLTYEDVTNVDSVGIITAQYAIFVGPKIGIGVTLNGITGKITTRGNIVSTSSTTEFAKLEPAGVLKLESDNPSMVNGEALQIRYDGVQKTKLSYTGNAVFTGIVTTNNGIEVGPSSGIGITLNANGNASFVDATAHTYLARTTNDTFGTFITRNVAGNNTATIYQNGNATFDGTLISTYSPTNGGYGFLLANPSNTAQSAGGLYQKDGGASSLYLKSVWSGVTTIDLDGDGGTATFAGDVQSGGNPYTGSPSAGVKLDSTGALVAARASGDVFTGKNTSGGAVTSSIGFDGSASFGGGNLTISSGGWLQTVEEITSDRTSGNVFRGKLSGTVTSSIGSDGRGDFGAITVDLNLTPTSGTSIENFYTSNGGVIQAYDRDNNNLEPLQVRGSNWSIPFDGAASFGGRITPSGVTSNDNITANRTSGTSACFVGQLNGTDTSYINANGSVVFGTNANGLNSASDVSLITSSAYRNGEIFKVTADGNGRFYGSVRSGDAVETSSSSYGIMDPSGQLVLQNNIGTDSKAVFTVFNGNYSAGSEKIQMLASGKATFAGPVTGDINSQYGGSIQAQNINGNGYLWKGFDSTGNPSDYTSTTTGLTSWIKASGSAKFASTITAGEETTTGTNVFASGSIQGMVGGVEKWYIGVDGATTFDGIVTSESSLQVLHPSAASSSIQLWGGYAAGSATSSIKSDGSATFSAGLTAQSLRTSATGGQVTANYNLVTESTASSLGLFIGCSNSGGAAPSNSNASITGDGTAKFAGDVSAGGFNIVNVTGNIGGTGGSGVNDMYIGNGSSNKYLRVITGGTGTGNVNITGSFTAAGNVTAYSDITLKKNIEVIPNALDKVLEIRGVTFDRTDKECARQSGVIAQEVEKVLPEVVDTNEDGIKSVAYGNIVGLLIEAIKEQQVQIDELKAKLEVK